MDPMRVWLIKIGEPLPIDGDGEWVMRSGLIARSLEEAGHHVVWWSDTFSHAEKRLRCAGTASVRVSDGLELMLLHGGTYARNVSFARWIHHKRVALALRRLCVPSTLSGMRRVPPSTRLRRG